MCSLNKILLIAILVASCTSQKVPFTSELRKKYNLSDEQLKKVQFYTSSDIVLTKTETGDEASINNGRVLLVNKNNSETIIIKKNTPCILVYVLEENKFLFSFEYLDNRVLLFGNSEGGCYSLMAKDWKLKHGVIRYANQTYTTSNGDVYLTIKSNTLKQIKGRERTIYGRHI